jgi:pSer/pThr/pTyr-binding forkhead associated (FHA) protein
MAYLVVCDDGSSDGEVLRLRDSTFVIGRTDGDFRIPHDPQVSGRHIEISRRIVDGKVRWVVTDLGSANGLFVRVSKTPLADGAELLVGRGRYRFDLPDVADAAPPQVEHNSTMVFAESGGGTQAPTLTEILGGGAGKPLALTHGECWIGSDPFCDVRRADDPFCHPRHCRLVRTPAGGWTAEHPKTLNGLWLRVPHVTAADSLQFQIGEQRFKLRVEPGKPE